MTTLTHQTAPTQFAEAGGIRFAYRRFGIPGAFPLVFNQHGANAIGLIGAHPRQRRLRARTGRSERTSRAFVKNSSVYPRSAITFRQKSMNALTLAGSW
jgi:hypothetical protein